MGLMNITCTYIHAPEAMNERANVPGQLAVEKNT